MSEPSAKAGLVIARGDCVASPRGWIAFDAPAGIAVARHVSEVEGVLNAVEDVTARGLYAAGFLSYEASPAFDPAMRVRPGNRLPLAWFGFYRGFRDWTPPAPMAPLQVPDWKPSVNRPAYDAAVREVKELIAAGDTYQVNYTLRLQAAFHGDPQRYFMEVVRRQPTAYSMLIDIGESVLCSASPELFFQLEGHGLVSRPMKGTWARGHTPAEDAANAAALKDSPKNRAENVMIVDMIRNDMGRVARPGTVTVRSLFDVERYPTLFQMTSTVCAETAAPLPEIFRALFPCASITGAPKIRTMEIIASLETAPRGIYTGCMGVVCPNRRATFSVAIRTAHIDREMGTIEYGIGGGITADSDTDGEYDECCAKAAVVTGPKAPFALFETILWEPEKGYFLLDRHLNRIADSAAHFSFSIDTAAMRDTLEAQVARFAGTDQRVRLLLSPDGSLRVEAKPLVHSPGVRWKVALAEQPVDEDDPWLRHKTTQREVYEAARDGHKACDDVILWNRRGETTESTIANVVARIDGALVTPPVSCGLLPGVFRAQLLSEGTIREEIIPVEKLARAEELFLINSVRRWIPVDRVNR